MIFFLYALSSNSNQKYTYEAILAFLVFSLSSSFSFMISVLADLIRFLGFGIKTLIGLLFISIYFIDKSGASKNRNNI